MTYHLSYQIKQDELGQACMGQTSFCGETRKNKTTWMTRCKCKNNVKKVPK